MTTEMPSAPSAARRVATLAMALFLSGCLTSDKVHTQASTGPVQPAVEQSASASSAGPEPAQTAALTPAIANWTLDDLADATPDTVKQILGTPAFVRTEPPAAYWRYGDDTCALDVYLYADSGGPARVRHAEVRRQSAGDALGCLEHLQRSLVAGAAETG